MGLFDKIKDTAGSIAGSVKDSVETAKTNHEQKKAEQEAYRAEMTAKAKEKSAAIISSIESFSNDGSVFDNIEIEILKSFTKEFRDKILLPASSVSNTHISMFPAISEKDLEKFVKVCPDYNRSDEALIHLKNGKQQIIITPTNLYLNQMRLTHISNVMNSFWLRSKQIKRSKRILFHSKITLIVIEKRTLSLQTKKLID